MPHRVGQPGPRQRSSAYVPTRVISPFGGIIYSPRLIADTSVPTFLIFLLAYVFDLLRIASTNYHASVYRILVALVIPLILSMVYVFLDLLRNASRLSSALDLLKRSGAAIPGVEPGKNSASYLIRNSVWTVTEGSAYVICGLMAVQVGNLTILPVPLHPLGLVLIWAVVGLSGDVVGRLRATRAVPRRGFLSGRKPMRESPGRR